MMMKRIASRSWWPGIWCVGVAMFLGSLTGVSQDIPAGAHSVDDHSREDAVNAQINAAEGTLEKGDFAGAEGILRGLALERPKDARVLYDLGFAEERTGKTEDAAKAYAGAIAANGDLVQPRMALGLLEAREGHLEAAHGQLAAVAGMPSAPPELKGRALRALARLDETANPDAAKDELIAAIKLTGETPDDIALTADMAAKAGDPEDAAPAYRRALAANPGDIDAAVGLAAALEKQNKLVEAEGVLNESLKAHQGDIRLVSRLAAVYADEGKAAQAEPLLEQLHQANPQNATVTRMLAHIYGLNGEDAKAEALYRDLVTGSPEDPFVLDDLGGILVKEQKYAEAEQILGKAVNLRAAFHDDQAWGEAAGHLAFAASRAKHPELSLQALAARATVLPNSPSSLFLEAIAHDALHQNKDAERAYRAFLAVAGGNYPDEEFQARHRLVALEHEK